MQIHHCNSYEHKEHSLPYSVVDIVDNYLFEVNDFEHYKEKEKEVCVHFLLLLMFWMMSMLMIDKEMTL